jgi:hypothetical protein
VRVQTSGPIRAAKGTAISGSQTLHDQRMEQDQLGERLKHEGAGAKAAQMRIGQNLAHAARPLWAAPAASAMSARPSRWSAPVTPTQTTSRPARRSTHRHGAKPTGARHNRADDPAHGGKPAHRGGKFSVADGQARAGQARHELEGDQQAFMRALRRKVR